MVIESLKPLTGLFFFLQQLVEAKKLVCDQLWLKSDPDTDTA